MDNLEDFLKGPAEQPAREVEPSEQPETQAAEEIVSEAVTEQPQGPVRDEKGRFAPKGETVAEEPQVASPATTEPQLDHAALIGERRRRQEAEDRIRALEEQFAKLQQPQAEQPQGPPDRWEDPEGYDQWLIGQATKAAEQQAVHAYQQQRIYSSAVRARSKYEDYDQAHQVFGEMVQRNPALYDHMIQNDDPAEFAYRTAKTELDIRQHGSLDALVQARVQAAIAAQAPAPVAPIPDTLADAQSSRGTTAALTVPSLNDILRR
jgi:hypothetical protein